MLVKSKYQKNHIQDLTECFSILRKYNMKLNPQKCSFGVSSGKFLGFIVNARGIEANPDKIKALIDMPSPRKHKDVQSLTGRMASLNRFISKSTDKCVCPSSIYCEGIRSLNGLKSARQHSKLSRSTWQRLLFCPNPRLVKV